MSEGRGHACPNRVLNSSRLTWNRSKACSTSARYAASSAVGSASELPHATAIVANATAAQTSASLTFIWSPPCRCMIATHALVHDSRKGCGNNTGRDREYDRQPATPSETPACATTALRRPLSGQPSPPAPIPLRPAPASHSPVRTRQRRTSRPDGSCGVGSVAGAAQSSPGSGLDRMVVQRVAKVNQYRPRGGLERAAIVDCPRHGS